MSNLKYRDLDWDTKRAIDSTGCGYQPTKSQNPTVKNILDRFKARLQREIEGEYWESARITIGKLRTITGYLINNEYDTKNPKVKEK